MLRRIAGTVLATAGLAIGTAIVVLAVEAQFGHGHSPRHVGCKHGHGSSWLQSHSRRGATSENSPEKGNYWSERSGLHPFTAFGR